MKAGEYFFNNSVGAREKSSLYLVYKHRRNKGVANVSGKVSSVCSWVEDVDTA